VVNEWWFTRMKSKQRGRLYYALYGTASILTPALFGMFYGAGLPTTLCTSLLHGCLLLIALVKEIKRRIENAKTSMYQSVNKESENKRSRDVLDTLFCFKLFLLVVVGIAGCVMYMAASNEWDQNTDTVPTQDNQETNLPSTLYDGLHSVWHLLGGVFSALLLWTLV